MWHPVGPLMLQHTTALLAGGPDFSCQQCFPLLK
jgi:hypothetical protein